MQLQFLATDEYIFGLVVSVRDTTTMCTVPKAATDKSHKRMSLCGSSVAKCCTFKSFLNAI